MKILCGRCLYLRVIALILSLFLVPNLITPALATPQISEKRAQLQRVKAQIDEINRKLDEVVEEYNQANLALNRTRREIRYNVLKLQELERDLAQNREILNDRVVGIYKHGKLKFVEVIFNAKSFDEFLFHFDLLIRIGSKDAQIVKRIIADKAEMEKRREELQRQEREQRLQEERLRIKKAEIEAELSRKRAFLSSLQEEITALQREEEARQARLLEEIRRDQERRRRMLQEQSEEREKSRVTVSRGAIGAARGDVVGIAMRYLGRPYAWGTAGPNAFDCSGFVMYCYGQVGVSLPHSSAAQYSCGKRVSRDELQPGDLVFFGRRHISHVGIYIGGGNFIHASSSGDVVKISSLDDHGGYVGACRP